MEEIKNASISVNLSQGNIIISGSEEFVEKNMDAVFLFVERANKKYENHPRTDNDNSLINEFTVTQKTNEDKRSSSVDKYVENGVYHVNLEDGEISILKRIPGNSKSEKVKNIALIVLYIRKEKITGKDIIPICEKHNCYDQANFATVFKNEKTNFIRKGSGQKWTLEITQPGEEAAKSLLEEMSNNDK
ncbi:MAG: hypothetical protein KBS62_07250 [Oscillospiraceae bacterium]|nr:hypothetical protein [Candidatus Ruminococcus equi]